MSAGRLLDFATMRFGDSLTDADKTLFQAVANGQVAYYGEGNPAEADTWGEDRVLRADRIEWLCTDREAVKKVTHKGVQIKGARIEGTLAIGFARIAFPLVIRKSAVPEGMVFEGAHLVMLILDGTHTGPILADGLRVEQSVFMREGFQAAGEVRLLGAKIDGNLECDKGHFSNPTGRALNAAGVDVKGSVFLREQFQAQGAVDFAIATVGGSFQWSEVKNPELCTLRLESARIGTLVDEKDSWPAKLYLDGLVYDRLYNEAPLGWKERLKWLKRQDYEKKFVPQPYVQLAKVLKEMGHEEDAKNILIEKERARRRYGKLGLRGWVWNLVLDVTIRYGYRTPRALVFLLLILLSGTWVFMSADGAELMWPSKERVHMGERFKTPREVPTGYPVFTAFVYSLDTLIPLVELHQQGYWLPNANEGSEWLGFTSGAWLRVYLWMHIGAGWVFTTLAVAGFTGLVRRE